MRLYPVMALVSSAFALAACGGGGGGLSSGLASRANTLSVCAINDTSCIATNTGGTPTTPAVPDTDGDGIPDNVDTNGNTGSGAGGNTTATAAGLRTLAIFASKADKATTAPTALSILTSAATPTMAATEAAILSTNKPKTLKIAVDTKSGGNSQFPVAIEQKEFILGTRDLTWIELNHVNTAGFALVDKAGNPVTYNSGRGTFVYSTTHTFGGVTYNRGTNVDTSEDFYWNQLVPFMGSKANGGAKENYREYRAIDKSPTVNRDEVLQVWAWDSDSYSTHYGVRDGDEWSKHAWSYGGKAATTMPTSGSATYRGRFVGNAKSSNWTKPDGAEIDPNANWRIQGRSELVANFGTNDIRGTLSTESWTSKQAALNNGDYTWFTQEAANTTAGNIAGTPSIGNGLRPNYYQIYDAQITLEGKIKAPAGVTTGTPVLNNFDGTATLNSPYLSSNNPLYGGFFGTNGNEATGIFSVSGQTVSPIGGSTGLNGNQGAFLDMNGSFNAKCVVLPPVAPATVGQCAP
jgi:hypothetical protein